MISVSITAAVVAAVVGALAGALATRFISKPYESRTAESLTRLQSDLEAERDERQALRDRLDIQEKKRFDVLHEQRAQVMRETYSALCDLSDAFEAFSRSFKGFIGGPGPLDSWEKLKHAGETYRKAFWPNRILFEKSLADDLSRVDRAYIAVANKFMALVVGKMPSLTDAQRTDEVRRKASYDSLQELLTSGSYRDTVERIRPLEEKVEAAFRRVYGVEQT